MEIKELDEKLIYLANSNSFNGNRGDLRNSTYKNDVDRILRWNISLEKKQKILDKLYDKHLKLLSYEAQHVSVMVAGPANYNSKKLDKSDKILELSHDLHLWLEEIENQLDDFGKKDNEKVDIVNRIKATKKLPVNIP